MEFTGNLAIDRAIKWRELDKKQYEINEKRLIIDNIFAEDLKGAYQAMKKIGENALVYVDRSTATIDVVHILYKEGFILTGITTIEMKDSFGVFRKNGLIFEIIGE